MFDIILFGAQFLWTVLFYMAFSRIWFFSLYFMQYFYLLGYLFWFSLLWTKLYYVIIKQYHFILYFYIFALILKRILMFIYFRCQQKQCYFVFNLQTWKIKYFRKTFEKSNQRSTIIQSLVSLIQGTLTWHVRK